VGEALPMLTPSFNRSLIIEARPERLSADGGAVLLRELLERSGIIPWMVARLADPRVQDQVTYRLAELHVFQLHGVPPRFQFCARSCDGTHARMSDPYRSDRIGRRVLRGSAAHLDADRRYGQSLS
jgi:hypothetical protein